jgi:hypothetical protein
VYNLASAISPAFLMLLKHRRRGVVLSLLFGSLTLSAQTQPTGGFYGPTGPFPPYRKVELEDYNIKWGRMKGHLDGSLRVVYDDNIFLSKTGAKSDFSFYPNLTLGFLWPVTRDQTVQLDLGIGYLRYVRNDQLSYFYVAPDSRLEYRITVPDANLQIVFQEGIGTFMDPTSRPEISGPKTNAPSGFIFRRLSNTAGLGVLWRPTRPITVTGGYAFGLDRSLSGDFTEQDRDSHTFDIGVDYNVASAWRIGLLGNYAIINYVEKVLNSGDTYTVGPQFTFAPMQSLSVFGRVGFTEFLFDSRGTIGDSSDFHGVTFQSGLNQTLSRALSHKVQVGRRVDGGWDSNFTDLWEAQYALEATLTKAVRVNASLTYQNFAVSGPNSEKGERYLAQLSTGYRFARRWNAGLAYGFALKDAEPTALSYTRNRVSLELTHQF